MRSQRCLLNAFLLTSSASLFACGGDEVVGSTTGSPTTGSLVITTMTSGADPDPDGYIVQVDADRLAIGLSATIQKQGLLPGSHTVSLSGVAANCTVSGEAARTSTILRGDTSQVEFAIECVTKPPTSPPGHIVFRGIVDGLEDIYIMNADGSGVRNLTNSPTPFNALNATFNNFPALSPDGRRVAFDSYHDNEDHLVIWDTTGVSEQEIPVEFFYGPVAWAPEGTRLALVAASADRSGMEIWVVNSDGTGLRQLTHLGGLNTGPVWSPDGQRLALAHADTVTYIPQLYLVDADGSNTREFTDVPAGVDRISWSPDGSRLAFEAWVAGGESEIFVMPTAPGATAQRITFNSGLDRWPDWSPDGTALTFFSDRAGGAFEIYTMDANGQHPRQLTHGTGFSADSPDWGP